MLVYSIVLLFKIVSFVGIFIWKVFKYLLFLFSMYIFGFVLFIRILFEWKYLIYYVNFDGELILNIKNGFDIIVLFFFILLIFEDLIILSWVFIFLEFGKFFRNIGVLKYIFLDEIDFLLRIFLFFLYIVYFFWLLSELLILVVKGFSFCMYILLFFKIFLFWNFIKLIKFKVFCNILLIIVWRIFVWFFVWCLISL